MEHLATRTRGGVSSRHQTVRSRFLLALVLLTLPVIPHAQGSIIALSGAPGFSAATTTIGFDGLPNLTVVNTYYLHGGTALKDQERR